MNKEEAIKRLNLDKNFAQINDGCCIVNIKDIETVLSELKTHEKVTDNYLVQVAELKTKNIELKERLKNSIPKQVILDKIEELEKYRDLAKEQIQEEIIIADSDSLNYGRAEAHNKDMQVLQAL